MGVPIRILMVEDSEEDVELALRELRRNGYDPSYRRVDRAEELTAALEAQTWDIIIGDYTMPSFSGTQALSMIRSRGLDVPFIFVSGTIGEEMAVAAMRAGAQDYVVKGNLKRLPPVVDREMREAAARRMQAQADAERRVAQARYSQIVALAPDAIVSIDEDQRIHLFNRSAETLFGYTQEEVNGQFLDLLIPSRFTMNHRGLVERFGRTETGPRKMADRTPVWGRRKNGEEFPAEVSISCLTEDGRMTYMAIIQDVTRRRRDEERLRQLQRAVDQSANMVVITDLEGVIEYANPSLLNATGYEAGEVVGRKPSLWSSGKTGQKDYKHLWETILAGRDWHGEFANRCKDGSLITVSATISPIRNEQGDVTHFLGVQEDVTERRDIEEQLRRSQRMESIGQLTGGLAHDFNNLLAVIIGNLDLLEAGVADRPQLGGFAQMALRAAMRGAGLTRQLLAFARRQSLEAREFDMNELVVRTTDMLGRVLGEQVNVELKLGEPLWRAFADPTQVESALANLAINARDAMPRGGRLLIETANLQLDDRYVRENLDVTPGDYVVLIVSDTGTGIAADVLPRVFDPFFTTKPQGKGTGLGLSMVYGFAKQSQGHVRIYSDVGVGTTVKLALPRARTAEAVAAVPVQVAPADAPRNLTVLVVEDNVEVRQIVLVQLEDLGYRVLEAANAAAALTLLRSDQQIDILFTDVVMPGGMMGPELARIARERRPDLKVLMTSGYSEAQNGGNGEELKNILSKPYRKQDLARRLNELIAEDES